MTLVLAPEVGVPSLDEARQVAEAMAELGAGQVLAFGSVASGVATQRSDIDLVAVFDDLGDYACRLDMQNELLSRARKVTDHSVDVLVTDRAEWRHRTEKVSSSFEASIAPGAVVLIDLPPDSAVNWDKEIGMPADNRAEAIERLGDANDALTSMKERWEPGWVERKAIDDGDTADAAEHRHRRMVDICSSAAMAIESSLKAAICISGGPAPWAHDIAELASRLSPEVSQVARAVERVAPEAITMWRQAGHYGAVRPHFDLPEVNERAIDLTHTACDTADATARCIDPTGTAEPVAAQTHKHTAQVRDYLASMGIPQD